MAAYDRLKTHLAQIYRDDLESYTEGKTAFIDAALTAASASAE
jgi:GrpB-like predicted nucleotidyltransferase (UPF0157 family)